MKKLILPTFLCLSAAALLLAGRRGNTPAAPSPGLPAPTASAAEIAPPEGMAENPPLAAALRTGMTADKEQALNILLPEMMKRDIHAAARFAAALEPWAWREEVLHQVARTWAETDPEGAAKWAVTLRAAEERQRALNDICIQAAEKEPAAAVELADRFRLGDGGDTITENLLQIWATRDPEAALSWLADRPADPARDKAYARVAMAHAGNSPAEAADLAVEKIAPGAIQDEAVISVLHQWTLRDPEGAAAWVARFPESDLRERAERELAGRITAP